MTERRQEPRVPCVLDATWNGQSGAQQCRVTDLSWHGCFVQSVCAPEVDHEAVVTLRFGDERVGFEGLVRYVEPTMGFAVMFDKITFAQATAMALVLGKPASAVA